MTYYLGDIFKYYKQRDGKYNKKIFTKIVNTFNKMLINELLKAKTIRLGIFGTLRIVRANRNFEKPAVDWKASNQKKQKLLNEGKPLYDSKTKEGYEWLIFYTDDEFCMIKWDRPLIKNQSVYRFESNKGNKGLATKLKEYLNQDDRNKYEFSKIK